MPQSAIVVCLPHPHSRIPCQLASFFYPSQALKRKDERYTLIWPEKSEFVRMAARFGAIIVPFAAVGAEDGINQVRGVFEIRVCGACFEVT